MAAPLTDAALPLCLVLLRLAAPPPVTEERKCGHPVVRLTSGDGRAEARPPSRGRRGRTDIDRCTAVGQTTPKGSQRVRTGWEEGSSRLTAAGSVRRVGHACRTAAVTPRGRPTWAGGRSPRPTRHPARGPLGAGARALPGRRRRHRADASAPSPGTWAVRARRAASGRCRSRQAFARVGVRPASPPTRSGPRVGQVLEDPLDVADPLVGAQAQVHGHGGDSRPPGIDRRATAYPRVRSGQRTGRRLWWQASTCTRADVRIVVPPLPRWCPAQCRPHAAANRATRHPPNRRRGTSWRQSTSGSSARTRRAASRWSSRKSRVL